MPQTLFFAVKDDLLPVFETIEDGGALRYVKAERSLIPDYDSFSRGAEIPNLGKATSESAISSETFLVADPQTEINVRVVEQDDGIRSFHIDQLANPDTVTFSSGGIWKPRHTALWAGSHGIRYTTIQTAHEEISSCDQKTLHQNWRLLCGPEGF